jgi:hypothetical protein
VDRIIKGTKYGNEALKHTQEEQSPHRTLIKTKVSSSFVSNSFIIKRLISKSINNGELHF